jgi:hypothetical protein
MKESIQTKFEFLKDSNRVKYTPVVIYYLGYINNGSRIYEQGAESLLDKNRFEIYPLKDGYIL